VYVNAFNPWGDRMATNSGAILSRVCHGRISPVQRLNGVCRVSETQSAGVHLTQGCRISVVRMQCTDDRSWPVSVIGLPF